VWAGSSTSGFVCITSHPQHYSLDATLKVIGDAISSTPEGWKSFVQIFGDQNSKTIYDDVNTDEAPNYLFSPNKSKWCIDLLLVTHQQQAEAIKLDSILQLIEQKWRQRRSGASVRPHAFQDVTMQNSRTTQSKKMPLFPRKEYKG
jgi:hypothetical protein